MLDQNHNNLHISDLFFFLILIYMSQRIFHLDKVFTNEKSATQFFEREFSLTY